MMMESDEAAKRLTYAQSYYITPSSLTIELVLTKFSNNNVKGDTVDPQCHLYLPFSDPSGDGEMVVEKISKSLARVGLTAKNIKLLISKSRQGFGSAIIEMNDQKDALFAVNDARWLWIEGCVYPLSFSFKTDNKRKNNPSLWDPYSWSVHHVMLGFYLSKHALEVQEFFVQFDLLIVCCSLFICWWI